MPRPDKKKLKEKSKDEMKQKERSVLKENMMNRQQKIKYQIKVQRTATILNVRYKDEELKAALL